LEIIKPSTKQTHHHPLNSKPTNPNSTTEKKELFFPNPDSKIRIERNLDSEKLLPLR